MQPKVPNTVEGVRVSIMINADKSDPLNMFVSVNYKAVVNGKRVGGRCIVNDCGLTLKDQLRSIEGAIAGVVAKLLSGEHPFSCENGVIPPPEGLGEYPKDKVHECHWKDSL